MKSKSFLKKNFIWAAVALLMMSIIFFGCGQEEAEDPAEMTKLTFGAVPGEDVELLKAQYEPLVDYLGEQLDMETEFYIATDYTGTIEAMRAGKVDLAWFGALSYVFASQIADAESFAVGYMEEDGIYYEGYIITHQESGITNIKDLKGKTFAFVDPTSTGGYLIPRQEMENKGIDPYEDISEINYVGGHDACAIAVKNQNVDAAAIVKHQYERALDAGHITEDEIRIIHVSDPFPGGPIAWRKELPENVKETLKDSFVNMPDEDFKSLEDLMSGYLRFEAVDDTHYDSIRKAVENAGLDLEDLE